MTSAVDHDNTPRAENVWRYGYDQRLMTPMGVSTAIADGVAHLRFRKYYDYELNHWFDGPWHSHKHMFDSRWTWQQEGGQETVGSIFLIKLIRDQSSL